MTVPALVAISHGTRSEEGRTAVRALAAAVADDLPGVLVRLGHVDVEQPDVRAALDGLPPGMPAVVVPLLLSAGYHVHVDCARAVRRTVGRQVGLAGALGPDVRLVDILEHRLRASVALTPETRVVLGAAGSSDARAVADCQSMGAALGARLGIPVSVGFLATVSPRLDDLVRGVREASAVPGPVGSDSPARVVVASYLLAPGTFQDLALAAGADAVAPPLVATAEPAPPTLVALVRSRYESAVEALCATGASDTV